MMQFIKAKKMKNKYHKRIGALSNSTYGAISPPKT